MTWLASFLLLAYRPETRANKIHLQRALQCDMGGVFNDKVWAIDRYAFEY